MSTSLPPRSVSPDVNQRFTLGSASKLTRRSEKTLRRWIEQGRLNTVHGPQGPLVRLDDVMALVDKAVRVPNGSPPPLGPSGEGVTTNQAVPEGWRAAMAAPAVEHVPAIPTGPPPVAFDIRQVDPAKPMGDEDVRQIVASLRQAIAQQSETITALTRALEQQTDDVRMLRQDRDWLRSYLQAAFDDLMRMRHEEQARQEQADRRQAQLMARRRRGWRRLFHRR